MKNHYRFMALLISCTLAGAAPMSALCSEAVSAGETSAAAEIAEEEEPGTEVMDEEAAEEPSETKEETTEGTTEGAGTVEAGIENPEEKPAGNEETDYADYDDPFQTEDALPVTEGDCGEKLTWEYREGVLYIEGTGEMYDYDEEILPEWRDYADQIAELHIDKGITLVDGDAFEGLKELRTIYFEGNEKEWKELAYENDRTEEELEQYPEGTVEKEEIGTVGEEGAKGAFAGVTEYDYGEEIPEEEEAAEETGEEAETAEVPGETAEAAEDGAEMASADSLQIVTEPEDISAAIGENVSLHVEANMEADFQWQWSRDGKTWKDCMSVGNDTDTFSFEMRDTLNGRKYRCIVSDGSDEIMTRTATVTVAAEEEALEITSQPEDITAAMGEQASVHVEANRADAAYQWQWSRDGKTWKDCMSAGNDTDTFSFEVKDTLNGRHYRCVVTSGSEQVISEEAVVHVAAEALEITSQPEGITAAAGEQVSFHVEANKAVVTYKWQWSANGTTWKDCKSTGFNTDTLSFEMKDTYDGRQYRCIVTSGTEQVTSAAASVSFAGGLEITGQPEDVSAPAGETVNFHVTANKEGVTYKWQWRADSSASWKDCRSTGFNTDTLSFDMKDTYDGRQYRCIITSGSEQVTSREATVSFMEGLRITEQPWNVSASAGETVSFHVEANKAGVTYRWQWSANGTTWKDCKSTGFNTDTLSFEMKDTYDGRQYRCIVTSGTEQVTSSAASVTFAVELGIVTQPEDVEAEEGAAVNFHVEANRESVTYRWQWSADSGATWKDCKSSGYNTATMSFEMRETYSGRQYRCIVTAGTQSVTSRAAQLTFADPEIVIEGVVYKLIDNVMTVTGYRGSADDVVVQETVEGHTVTVIGESAFEGSTIRSIDLPDTIQLIKKRAFANCSNLTNMN